MLMNSYSLRFSLCQLDHCHQHPSTPQVPFVHQPRTSPSGSFMTFHLSNAVIYISYCTHQGNPGNERFTSKSGCTLATRRRHRAGFQGSFITGLGVHTRTFRQAVILGASLLCLFFRSLPIAVCPWTSASCERATVLYVPASPPAPLALWWCHYPILPHCSKAVSKSPCIVRSQQRV